MRTNIVIDDSLMNKAKESIRIQDQKGNYRRGSETISSSKESNQR